MKERKLRQLRVDDLQKHGPAETERRVDLSRTLMTSGPMTPHELTDLEVVQRFATKDELAELRERIEERRDLAPKFTFWRCSKCGRGQRGGPQMAGGACVWCNPRAVEGQGWLRQLASKKEIAAFLAEEVEAGERIAEKTEAASLHNLNNERAKEGSPPLSIGEYRVWKAKDAAEARAEQERMRAVWERSRT